MRCCFYVLGLSIFFTVLIAGLVIYFAIRYRRRSANEVPPRLHGAMWLEIGWTVIPFLLVMILFGWGANVFFALARAPDDALEIYVVGRQWMWKIQHPEGQREINTLHIPVDQPVKLTMTSEDVIHSFFVPAFRTKQDVVPGRFSTTWFEATKPGTYRLFCAEYCGTEHAKMVGTVVVMKPADYQKWLQEGAEGSLALQGRKLFTKLQCITCHGANAQAGRRCSKASSTRWCRSTMAALCWPTRTICVNRSCSRRPRSWRATSPSCRRFRES